MKLRLFASIAAGWIVASLVAGSGDHAHHAALSPDVARVLAAAVAAVVFTVLTAVHAARVRGRPEGLRHVGPAPRRRRAGAGR